MIKMMKLAVLLVVGVIARHAYGDEPEAIVDSTQTTLSQFSYLVSLQKNGEHICSGSIISKYHILTTRHCVYNSTNYSDLAVVTGVHRRAGGDGVRHEIKCILLHPKYTDKSTDNLKDNIAIIKLKDPFHFNQNIQLIPLATRDNSLDKSRGNISRLEKTNAIANSSLVPLSIKVNVLTLQKCLDAYPRRDKSTNSNFICTRTDKKGTCIGDNNGFLIMNNQLSGIASWMPPCALDVPDVFVNIYYYLDLIKQFQEGC